MRTIIDIPDAKILPLDEIAQAEDVSRAQLIREAVDMLLKSRRQAGAVSVATHPAFGMWKDRAECADAVEYQRRLRAEWGE